MKSGERKMIIRGLSLLTSLGVTMAACVLIGLWIGKALDSVMNTAPWMTLIFLLIGIIAAIKSMLSIILKEWNNPQ